MVMHEARSLFVEPGMAATSCNKSSCGRACGRALWQGFVAAYL